MVLASCMAPISDRFFRAVAEYLSEELDIRVEVLDAPDWRERERQFDAGRVDLCWICGLPYVRKADHSPGKVRLVAAPVMAGPRYAGRPNYYSDVIVRADDPAESLEQLVGSRWAYNETGSHSGYSVVLAEMARKAVQSPVLAGSIEAGSHERALRMVVAGQADYAAIDSTVLELELERWPELSGLVRAVTTLGPSPIPPLLAGPNLSERTLARVKTALVEMHATDAGRQAFILGRASRFVEVKDHHYDPIREADRLSATIEH